MNLKITISAQPAYLANLILIWHCVRSGLMDPSLAWPMSLLIVIPMLMIYAVIRFGWTRRLRDPAITVPQMMNALVFIAIGSLTSSPMHIALLSTVAVTMAYSVFALKGRQVVFVQAFSLALFGLGSLVMHHLQPQYYKPEVEILLIAILATTVVMLTWSGSQIAELRARQRRQREELAQMLTRIEELATHDVLTGLYNRRHMNALLAHHVERTQRYGPPLTLAMLDLDHFKQVNDTHGHGVGDDVLKTFASTAQAALDGTDTLARWGGEEFLLMSTANPPDVLALLERLRQQLADTPASPQVPSLRVSFSAGVAFHRVGDAITHTINRADEALYEAKSAGRAQSRLAPDTQAGEGTIVSTSLAPAPVPAPAAALAQA
ncbi:MAG: GGDEF domain-containing protein, partial [Pseudomonadota bacterium]